MKKTLHFSLVLLCFFTAHIFAQLESPILVEPPKDAQVVNLPVTLDWQEVSGADCYLVEITLDPNSEDKEEHICNATYTAYHMPLEETERNTTYFWRVTAHDVSGWGTPSEYFNFTTADVSVEGTIGNLTDGVIDLIAEDKLTSSQGSQLISRLDAAEHYLSLGNTFLANLNMYLFKLRVMILRTSSMLSTADADALNYSADGVIDLIAEGDAQIQAINFKELSTPKEYSLGQNYPNPFNPSTTIEYSIPKNSVVSLKIYDMLGKEVATLTDRYQEAGTYIVNWNASHLSSGVYFYKLSAGSFIETKKMILSK
jgi:hypothetical protein